MLSGKKFNVYLGMDKTNLASWANVNGEELKYDENRKLYYIIREKRLLKGLWDMLLVPF